MWILHRIGLDSETFLCGRHRQNQTFWAPRVCRWWSSYPGQWKTRAYNWALDYTARFHYNRRSN